MTPAPRKSLEPLQVLHENPSSSSLPTQLPLIPGPAAVISHVENLEPLQVLPQELDSPGPLDLSFAVSGNGTSSLRRTTFMTATAVSAPADVRADGTTGLRPNTGAPSGEGARRSEPLEVVA